MEFIPTDSVLFRKAIEGLKDFLPQAQLYFKETGLMICGMDSAHVVYLDFFLSSEDCKKYSVEDTLTIGVDLTILTKTLGSITAEDSIKLSSDGETLRITYTKESVKKDVEYEIPLIDIDGEIMNVPDVEYSSSFKAKSADVLTVLKEVSSFGDTIKLNLDDDGFHILVEGDNGKVKQCLGPDDEREMAFVEGDNDPLSFSMKYLMYMVKHGGSIANDIHLDMDTQTPLRAMFNFGKSSHWKGFLAPKVVDE